MFIWVVLKFIIPVIVPPGVATFLLLVVGLKPDTWVKIVEVGGLYWFSVAMSTSSSYDLLTLEHPQRGWLLLGHLGVALFSSVGYGGVIQLRVQNKSIGLFHVLPSAIFAFLALGMGIITYFGW